VRLVDTGIPEEVAKLQNYLHELLGHFGLGLIKGALPLPVDEDLVRYLKKVTSSVTQSACLAGTWRGLVPRSLRRRNISSILRERGISPSSGCRLLWQRSRDLPT
jgi:hypothetical protein